MDSLFFESSEFAQLESIFLIKLVETMSVLLQIA